MRTQLWKILMIQILIYTIKIFNNRIKANIELLKVDTDTSELLDGVNFKITCVDGFMKDKTWYLTTENGKINLNDLEYGIYRIDEVSTLWNYVLNSEPIYFDIKENNKPFELVMENKKTKANVELIKVDTDTQRPLEGPEFELWNGERLVGTYITNKDGKIVVENL